MIRLLLWLWASVRPNWWDALTGNRERKKKRQAKVDQIAFVFGLIGRFYAIRYALDNDLRVPSHRELSMPREVFDAIMRAMYLADGKPVPA